MAIYVGEGVPHPFLGSHPSLKDLDGRGDPPPSLSPLELYGKVKLN
jgi:hypothetical protein